MLKCAGLNNSLREHDSLIHLRVHQQKNPLQMEGGCSCIGSVEIMEIHAWGLQAARFAFIPTRLLMTCTEAGAFLD